MGEETEHLRELIKQYKEIEQSNYIELKNNLLTIIQSLHDATVAMHNQLFVLESKSEINKNKQN